MKSFLIAAAFAATLAIAMFVVMQTAAVSQVERYDSVAVHVGEQQGGHVIIHEQPAAH